MKYKAVIFDLFGTLVYNSSPSESNQVLRQMAREISMPDDDFIKMWLITYEERMKGIFKRYKDCIRYICQQTNTPVLEQKIESAAKLRSTMAKREISLIRDGAIEILSYLKSNDYKTGLVSDCSMDIPELWEDTPLSPFIDVAIFSCRVNMKKPDPRVFRMVIEQLDSKPKECLYIADGIGQELTTASKLGMSAVMIHSPDDREEDPYREDWHGPAITSLKEVMDLL